MKQTILTLLLSMFFISMYALPLDIPEYKYGDINYVLTDSSIHYFQKLRRGFTDRLIAKNEGQRVVFDLNKVKEFRADGKVYEKKYVVTEGSNTVEAVFMQKLCTCAGYTLYKRMKGANEELKLSDFYVYFGEIQMYQLNLENYKVILSFFFTKFNEMYA